MIQMPIPKPIRFINLTVGSFFRPLSRNIKPVKIQSSVKVDEDLFKQGKLCSQPVHLSGEKKIYLPYRFSLWKKQDGQE